MTVNLKTFVQNVTERSIPLAIHWDITWLCDHKCVHCYLTDRRQPELKLHECIEVLDQLARAGTMTILFSGGDPFIRKDALDIFRAARERGFDVRLNTHGNFIDDKKADALAEMGVSRVSMSLYSVVPEHHEAITLIKGSCNKTIAAARRLIDRDVIVNFKTPLTVHNRLSYRTVGALAREIGASWELDAHIAPDDQSDFDLCQIGAARGERILAMMHEMDALRDEVVGVSELPDTPSTNRTCSAGTAFGHISPDGRLFPCINWRDEIGSLRESSFEELWAGSPKLHNQRKIRRSSYLVDCEGCTFHGKCNYCPGLSHAESGNAGRRSAEVCERTHLIMSAIDRMNQLRISGEPVPDPGSEAARLMMTEQTFADQQWERRKAGIMGRDEAKMSQLIQIREPQASAR